MLLHMAVLPDLDSNHWRSQRRAMPPRPLAPGCKLSLLAGRNIANPKWMRVLGNARVGMLCLAPVFGFSLEGGPWLMCCP